MSSASEYFKDNLRGSGGSEIADLLEKFRNPANVGVDWSNPADPGTNPEKTIEAAFWSLHDGMQQIANNRAILRDTDPVALVDIVEQMEQAVLNLRLLAKYGML